MALFATIFRGLEGLELLFLLCTLYLLYLYYSDLDTLVQIKERIVSLFLPTLLVGSKSEKETGKLAALRRTASLTTLAAGGSVLDQANIYPSLPKELVTDGLITNSNQHQVSCINPFACLEDFTQQTTLDFVSEQQAVTDLYVQHDLADIKQKLLDKLTQLSNFESIENPINLGGTYFFFKRLRPELPQYSLFATKDLNKEAKLVFDPNILKVSTMPAVDEVTAALDPLVSMPIVHATWISVDGYRLAYGYSHSLHSKELFIGIRDIEKGIDLVKDTIKGGLVDYTNVAWVESRTGFFYTTQVEIITHTADNSHNNNNHNNHNNNLNNHGNSSNGNAAHSPQHGHHGPHNSHHPTKKRQYSNRMLFHKLNTTQEHDFIVFETITDHNDLVLHVQITSDGHYLLLELSKRKHECSASSSFHAMVNENAVLGQEATGNKVYYYDLSKFDGLYAESLGFCVRLIDTFLYRFDYISNIEDEFWFRTNYKAANFRVVRISLPDISHEDMEEIDFGDSPLEIANATNRMRYKCLQAWKTCIDWIPQRKDGDYLEGAFIAAHTVLVLKYLKNASHVVLLYDLTQNLVEESQIPVADLPHPSHGTINGPNCNFYSSEIFYQYTDFADPSSIYRALIDRDPYTGRIEISFHQVNSTELPGGLEKHRFEIQHEFVESSRSRFVPIAKFGLRAVLDQDDDDDDDDDDDVGGRNTAPSTAGAVRPSLAGHIRELDEEADIEAKKQQQLQQQQLGRENGSSSSKKHHGKNNKKVRRDARPCLIYVNAGFGITATPSFSLPAVIFAQYCKGIVVIANVQGSGVYGKTWVEHGSKANKEHAVTDLLAVIKFLVQKGYTSYSQIALYGGGHNGAIIGAAIAKFPMIFNAAVIEDGVFDLMKYHEFNPTLSMYPKRSGPHHSSSSSVDVDQREDAWRHSMWYQEFGCMLESESEFVRLLELSALHNVAKNATANISTYPAVLCLADMGSLFHADSNIASSKHSIKFVAELQRVFTKLDCKKKPLLLHVPDLEDDTLDKVGANLDGDSQSPDEDDNKWNRAFIGTPMEETAMKFAFIIKNINAPWFD